MGRRKERRLAAMAAAGRRVKLDLFLDPSPGEESRKEGIGGENRDQQTVVPTSPSPSGYDCCRLDKKENPLALLGQYSDGEEEDEGAADQPTGETKGSPRDASVQVTDERVDIPSDKGDGHTEPSVSVDDKQEAPQTGDIRNGTQSIAEENTVAPEPSLENESATATEAIPDSSGMQIVGDVGGNWKAVMHEQSSQCYYWNTVTGETSWEMPNGLTSGVASDGVTSTSVPTHMDYPIEAQAHVLPHNTLEAYPSDMSVVNGTANYATFGMECGSTQITHAYAYTAPAASHGSMDIDPFQLAKYGEDLLQRLKLLERLRGSNEGLELISREIGIRISDCNALSSYGSSLLPLWLHAEVHLKELDCSISKLETSYCSDTEPRHLKTETAEHKAPNEADMMAPSNDEDLKSEDSAGVHIDEKATIEEPASTSAAPNPQDMVVSAVPSKVEYDSDEDMDVEMEVDEDNVDEQQMHSSSVPNEEHPPSGKESTPNLPPLEGPAPPEDNDVPPPPPEEEWIPPPPPDNEPARPPPMEEPVAPYVHVGTIAQPYIGQANVGYTLSGTEYYSAGSTEGTNGNYYIPATEAHVLQAQQHSYYAPVSASGMAVPVDGASIAPEPYYTYPSATMDASGVAAEHSVYYASSVSAISSSAVDTKTSSSSLVYASSNSDPTGPDKVISNDASVAPSSEVTVATAAAGTVSMVGSSTQASSTTTQSKVIRSKKRAVAVTSSLRSNKKVSSLVDKWKAAKEELRDEEEEPESALEALERKRQKEIEEWRKQQIASGEAKENANFVPLRGDWRDRVKRRRAEAKKESEKESTAASLSSAEQHKGQPDLAELSKGLPSGWQAYLDESTKQVYYGNSLTSETRWERPTK